LTNPQYQKNDPTYIGRSGYDDPKEYFKLIIGLIRDRYSDNPVSILDVGCASGAFLFYAKSQLQVSASAGLDISEKLLEQGRANLPGTVFHHGSIEGMDTSISDTFDVCTCLGTLAIFESIDANMQALMSRINPGGMLIIFDAFNAYPIDVIMKYRVSGSDKAPWQSALNIFSMATYDRVLDQIDENGSHEWIDFNMPFPIQESDDPMRAWTIDTDKKSNQVVVGTGQYLDQKVLAITKSL